MITEAFNRLIGRGLRLAKRAYQSLPLNYESKAAHRRAVARLVPKLLLLSGAPPASIPALAPVPKRLAIPIDPAHILPGQSGAIEVHSSSHPIVSIVIPVFGQVEYTIQCLTSIAANTPSAAIEVIVVDDCSPDGTAIALERVNGIRVIRNAENQGFIRSCNAGVAIARGEYLHFLNNDTVVTRGWLDELLRTFDEFPCTGFVGSKLIYPDGRLQEAGGIIWQDGSAWNFGRDQDAALPAYNYAREVDYCSGASIMVPRSIFNELGGFDERYLPAYCEDADLALKVRAAGYRVLYQPLSTVVHYEGITSGTDPAQGIKAYQVANTKRLFERWHEQLKSHQAPGEDPDRAKDRTAKRRVLVLDHATPTPDQDAGSVLVFNMLLLLREMDFQVTFIAEDNFRYVPGYTTALQRSGIEVLWAPHIVSVRSHLQEYGRRYDLVLLFRPAIVGRNIKAIRKYCPNTKVLFHTQDLHFLRMQREAELLNDKKKVKLASNMKRLEFTAIRSANATIVVSTAELELLHGELSDEQIYVLPLIIGARGTDKGFGERSGVVFIGGYRHSPNVDAVGFFATEVMPLLRERLPGVRFYAAGSNPTSEVQSLAGEDVVVTGYIEDLDSMLDKMRVSVAPLRYGAGIKGKIASAMAVGLPVVATTLAVEGTSLTNEDNVLLADDANALASAIARLYEDESVWNKLSKNGIEFADRAWGPEAAWRNLSDILSPLGFNPHRNARPLRLYSPVGAVAQRPPDAAGLHLSRIFIARDRGEFELGLHEAESARTGNLETRLVEAAKDEVISFDGFCVPCNSRVPLQIVMGPSSPQAGRSNPNWRETLTCPSCGMNNRQRLVATLLRDELDAFHNKAVYLMEQVTPIYRWALTAFPQHQIIGSEYLGNSYRSGQISKGLRHEDLTSLSFADESIDLVVSNDVFEHVPRPERALSECARVLRRGGNILATMPLHEDRDQSVVRARLDDDGVKHLLPPEFHGNPLSHKGSLVFTDFGWDFITIARAAGFDDMHVAAYASEALGHLGGCQLVFRGRKRGHDSVRGNG